MNIRLCSMLLAACAATGLVLHASAADRVRAGQWETTLNVAGMTMSKSMCMSQGDANALNGDANSVRAYAEKVGAATGCKVTDVKASGDQVTVKSICASGKENVGTTTYRGDSFESVNTNGARAQSKWIGACKQP